MPFSSDENHRYLQLFYIDIFRFSFLKTKTLLPHLRKETIIKTIYVDFWDLQYTFVFFWDLLLLFYCLLDSRRLSSLLYHIHGSQKKNGTERVSTTTSSTVGSLQLSVSGLSFFLLFSEERDRFPGPFFVGSFCLVKNLLFRDEVGLWCFSVPRGRGEQGRFWLILWT